MAQLHETPRDRTTPELRIPSETPILRSGQAVRIRMALEGRARHARIAAVRDRILDLTLRASSGPIGSIAETGQEVDLRVCEKDAMWLYRAILQGESPDHTLRVELADRPPQRRQRREFFRSPVRLSLLIDRIGRAVPVPLDPDTPFLPAEVAVGFLLLRLHDLSGGGCLCLDPERVLVPGSVHGAWLYLSDGQGPVALHVRVIRRARLEETPAAGLQFLSLRERDRERILRSLFREYRRQRAAQRSQDGRRSSEDDP